MDGPSTSAWRTRRICLQASRSSTSANEGVMFCADWRIIPVSKWLVAPIDKPFRPFVRRTAPVRGLNNHGYEPLSNWDDPPGGGTIQDAGCVLFPLIPMPRTQTALVLIGKGLVLGGLTFKNTLASNMASCWVCMLHFRR